MLRVLIVAGVAVIAALLVPRMMKPAVTGNASCPSAAQTASANVAREDAGQATSQRSVGGTMVLRAGRNGHYFANARINGRQIDVVVDTGASSVALTYEDARALGFNPAPADFTGTTRTANGTGRFAPVTLAEVRIGPVRVTNVRAAILPRGKLGTTLLGMSFLGRLSRADIRSGEMILKN